MAIGTSVPPLRYARVQDEGPARVLVFRESSASAPPRPRLLDRVRGTLRTHHHSARTEKAYVGFHGKRHPAEMGAAEVTRVLTSLAVDRSVAASTQNQALSALLFLYRDVLGQDLPWLDDLVRAKRPPRLPAVLTRDEVRAVLDRLDGVPRLMAVLMYGAGLRVLECARLRVKDVGFSANQIIVRGGKGDKDRVTMLPAAIKPDLERHLVRVRVQHQGDLADGAGWVELPYALARKYPQAGRGWGWQWTFPATRISIDRVTGQRRRHHLPMFAIGVRRPSAARRTGCSCDHGERRRDSFRRLAVYPAPCRGAALASTRKPTHRRPPIEAPASDIRNYAVR